MPAPIPLLDIRAWVVWGRDHVEAATLAKVGIAAAAIYSFFAIAGEVMEGETHGFDSYLLLALRNAADPAQPLGPTWMQEVLRDFTALGGNAVLTLITLAVAGFLWMQGNRRSMLLVLAAILGGFAMTSLLKLGFDRPRPDLVPHSMTTYTASFPSGHAMLSAIVYLTLAVLVARVQTRRSIKIYLLTTASLLTVIIGVSRVYLGVHWPTDVIAGWAAGAAWALLWWTIASWLERSGVVEKEITTEPKSVVGSPAS
ncbi:phosphatase PAP2 family protein [Aureimonas sp. SA4125]|uniref:phosphatase PAP2 family protein n=1 Tax=Aureimonas sp. SA4125 TaxID=2826993 RepID=UPI001CC4CDAA|nr:phosphatase PAP2 family protein [Aureimonas sp. SA4125]BDA84117.1 phosphatase PAP2 family protein [Aureimonas sp. SA4125]